MTQTNWNDSPGNDEPQMNHSMSALLPSTLRDMCEDGETNQFPKKKFTLVNPNVYFSRQVSSLPVSARNMDFPSNDDDDLNQHADFQFQGEIETDGNYAKSCYYTVKFNMYRSSCFYTNQDLKIQIGDYVLTEADRGYDIGVVVGIVTKPSPRDQRSAKMILRIAQQYEIDQLQQKAERELRALELCQAKVIEYALPMKIIGAEFQFYGKKLTFYYTSSHYIDFRTLVRTLFKVFGTRIWMCCVSEKP
ncbi:PSP1 C-terminal conserved region family protein [Histomonas meleagridis]|uniref:PSP1 C-terminal conserved region family protein n=1 Tax=Histomonas meleagridis TaxID=135588 RepID=UPI0035596D37|nr:PSP1 C-terminal conserved region family protein [Histomonas meleagridis]KAH0800136.1 PSP1 C-terminal conserved region family protein [Histomonas meleagridis]